MDFDRFLKASKEHGTDAQLYPKINYRWFTARSFKQLREDRQDTSGHRLSADMGAKSRYVIVQLASVISGTTRVWVRERAAEKFSGIFFDPA
uniref:Uncharacterized protein n=1 Tax=Parascaris univalens TaxID=6257 RepID=A0A915A8A9_PARUN